MEFTKEDLNLENGLEKEWLITNGIGGYSSSTIIGANTRKYHGLLVAPLTPPARRFLILSKLDESIKINEKKYDLYTNICKEYISKGYEYQEEFRKEYVPIFKYKIDTTEITKIICMEYGKNTVGVYYKIKNGENKAKLTLAPIINFRDFHTTNTDHEFNLSQSINKNKVKIVVDLNSQTPIYMNLSEGIYIKHENDNFKNMFYIEEEKRGFEAEENHAVPGRYEIEINPEEEKEISFVCSLEENIEQIDVKQLIDKEIIRLGEIFNQSLLINNRKEKKTKEEIKRDNLIKTYLIATDNFVVYRPNFGLHTVIAGYPWFLDWGRDTLIAFEGLLLVTKRFKIAKEVLKTMIRDIKFGLVPNGYSGYDNRPLYNSVDASLLLFEAVQKYINYTGDYQFIKEEIYKKLEDIIESYIKGIDVDNNNIYLDDDDLIVSGTQDTQNTWMDAKYDGVTKAIKESVAIKVYISNIMTEPGQTDNYSVSDHLNAIIDHCGKGIIDYCIYDTGEIIPEFIKKYNFEGQDLVEQDIEKVKGIKFLQRNLSMISDEHIRHDPNLVASSIIELICDDLKYQDKQNDPQYLMLNTKLKEEKRINKIKKNMERKSKKGIEPKEKNSSKKGKSKFSNKYSDRIASIREADEKARKKNEKEFAKKEKKGNKRTKKVGEKDIQKNKKRTSQELREEMLKKLENSKLK